MFTWLKNLFTPTIKSTGEPLTDNAALGETVDTKVEVKTPKKTAPAKAKKPKKVVAEVENLDSMSKTQLLELAKKRGIKANASLKKDELLARVKNG